MTVRILQGVDSLGRRYTSRAKDRPCAHCGQRIERRGSAVRYCSRDCYAAAIKGRHIAPEVAAARKRLTGDSHPQWSGDGISEKGGRKRALRMYRDIGPCVKCGSDHAERHHKDGNTANNEPSNIEALCRRCHMEIDGRLASVRSRAGRGITCR